MKSQIIGVPENVLEPADLREAALQALHTAVETHNYLLRAHIDRDEVGVNTFGDTVMKIDFECEEAVFEPFRYLARKYGVGFSVVSEEHGEFTIGANPAYTLFVDGFDGSSKYKQTGGKSRGGPMMAVYLGLNPRFDDYLVAGIADFGLKEIVFADRGEGVKLFTKGSWHHIYAPKGNMPNNTTPIYADEGVSMYDPSFNWMVTSSKRETLDDKTRIYIDEGVQNFSTFPYHANGYFYDPIKERFDTQYLGSSAVYFFDVATGRADLDLEYGRKECLEHWTGYPLIKEAGASMEFLSGGMVGPTRYRDYLTLNHGYPAIIIAATPELANEARAFSMEFNSSPKQ